MSYFSICKISKCHIHILMIKLAAGLKNSFIGGVSLKSTFSA